MKEDEDGLNSNYLRNFADRTHQQPSYSNQGSHLSSIYEGEIKNPEKLIEELRIQVSALTEERDAAVELWKLSETTNKLLKDELKNLQTRQGEIDELQKTFEESCQEYSDVIVLLESKLKATQDELTKYSDQFKQKSEEFVKLQLEFSDLHGKYDSLLLEHKVVLEERDSLKSRLKGCEAELSVLKESESTSRSKLEEAIGLVEESLKSESSLVTERDQLEQQVIQLMEEMNDRVQFEVDLIRSNLNSKLEVANSQLHVMAQEKSRLVLDKDACKAECSAKVEDLAATNKALTQQLQEAHHRLQSHTIQWNAERSMLRRRILSLQSTTEELKRNLQQV